MSWTLSIGVAVALLAVCGGQNTVNEENNLSPSGYHVCTHNETRTVSFLEVHEVPYSVSKPCGGWLLWKMCAVTIYRMIHQTKYKTVTDQVIGCCHGYVQVGRYCALPVNRSGEFSSKPGSCPTADGLRPSAEDCELDIDCPGLQKCCQRSGHSFCSDPATSANYSENGGNRLNATVTVKIDYQQMMSKNEGLLNHTRLLQAMVTGALQSEVSVYYLSTQPVCPYRTATSLLIDCSFTLSLFNVTSKLHLLLKRIEEASSITVQDVDECAHSALHQCSLQADCNNTVGSYQCACRQGYVDVDPSNPGAHCSADFGVSTTMEPTLPNLPLTNSAYPPASNSTHGPHGNNTTDFFNPSETSMTTAPSNTTSVPYNSSPASLWTNSASYGQVNSTVESPLPVTTCSPPSISSLWSANVTGTSFSVSWSGWSQINQTYVVVLSMSSEVIQIQETSDTMIEVSELNPGLLYKVAVTPCACGNQGVTLHIAVKTDAQTLQATARLTNINFTADLQNTSSQAYQNLSESIIQEIYQSLSPEMRAMVDSGQVEIEIRSFSPGSVVVDFSIVFIPSQNQSISNVSTAVLHSLMNSVKYTVDKNNTSINDINECASGENDCSQWATCNNTWGSYTCVCLVGFTDNNPERPGRACQVATFETVTPALTTGITASTTEPTVTTATAAPEITTDNTSKGQTSSTTVSSTAQATTTTTPVTSTPAPLTTITTTKAVSTTPTTATGPMTISAPPTNTTVPTATPAITTTAPRTTTNSLSITTTTNDSILGDFSVHCRVAAITVTITKNFLLSSKIQESALYLGKLGCGINGGNDTHVELTVAWDECDTKLVHNETHYIASVSLFNTMDPYVSPSGAEEVPSKQLKVPIMCAYMKSMLISADFSVMGNEMIDELIMGSWSPQVTMQLMNGTVPLPHNYSLSHQQPVVVEVRLNTSSDQIKLIINKCWATPTENPADTSSYVFLMNSCSLNTHTKVLTNGNSSTSRLSVQIFSFVSLTVIYLHCEIQICLPTKSYTCVPDCLQRSTRSANAVGIGFRSVGPLMSSEEELLDAKLSTLHVVGFSFLGIGLSLFFIGSLACLLYCQRNRIGHYNFNVKPKEENFTYLVFNT